MAGNLRKFSVKVKALEAKSALIVREKNLLDHKSLVFMTPTLSPPKHPILFNHFQTKLFFGNYYIFASFSPPLSLPPPVQLPRNTAPKPLHCTIASSSLLK